MQRYLLPIAMMMLAGALQGNLPGWLALKGAKPDLILVVLVATALNFEPVTGALFGFFAGMIHGSLVGYSLGSLIVSRTIIGFLASSITTRLFSENPIVPVLAAGGLTFVGEAVFLLGNPTSNFLASVNVVLAKSLYNSFLTLMVFWFLRWMDVRRKIKQAAARL